MLEDISAYDDPVLLGAEDDDDESMALFVWICLVLDSSLWAREEMNYAFE